MSTSPAPAPTLPEVTPQDVILEVERAQDEDPQEYAAWRRHHALDLIQRTRPQIQFLESQAQTALFWGGVRTGKSTSLALDCGLYLRGDHPCQIHCPPTVQLHAGRSWSQMVDQVRCLWGLLDPRWFQARLDLTTGSVKGQRYPLLTATAGPGRGSQIRLGTFEMGPLSVQGWTLHRAQLDEPPPQAYYTEVRSRVISTGGRVRLGYCPTAAHLGRDGRALDYVWDLVDSGEIHLVHAPLTLESVTPAEGLIRVPIFSSAEIEAFSREIPARDRLMRLGLARYPEQAGRYFDAWSPALIQALGVPPGYLVLGVDWGSKPGRTRATLSVVWGVPGPAARIHALRHYQSDGRSTEDDDAAAILALLEETGHRIEDVDYWVGDRAHHGDHRGGQKSNWRLKRALARLVGVDIERRDWLRQLPRPLQRMWTPHKYEGSDYDDMEVFHRMMVRGTLTTDPSCKPLILDCESWDGTRASPHKDGLDSWRYPTVPVLSPEWRRPS